MTSVELKRDWANPLANEPDEAGGNLDYRFEAVRLRTFKNWPCTWIKPEDLAAAGFYYTGQGDKVRCFECSINVYQWQPDDSPMFDHRRWSATCRFVREIDCGNVAIGTDPDTDPGTAPLAGNKDVCGPYNAMRMPLSGPDRNLDFGETVRYFSNISTVTPKYPEYASYDERLRTFDTWPASMKPSREQLAFAGLYYTGRNDQTLCYYCGGQLASWESDDEPWQQHAKWFEHCPYLLMVKGKEFIRNATRPTCAQMRDEQPAAASSSNVGLPVTETNVASEIPSAERSVAVCSVPVHRNSSDESKSVDKDARMCKICYSRELRMVFIPCGHLLTCAECAKNMKTCAVCRKPVRVTVHAYIS